MEDLKEGILEMCVPDKDGDVSIEIDNGDRYMDVYINIDTLYGWVKKAKEKYDLNQQL